VTVTAAAVKALLANLREDELGLPFVPCECWFDGGQVSDVFAQVTPTQILLHRSPAQAPAPKETP
jgi:hypothetical protein